ncbi:zinc finger domain-containing protein [Streptomyces celluloflavus]
MTDSQQPSPSDRTDADDVGQPTCPKCDARPGSPCRSRGGAVASACHTRRFAMVPRPKKALRVPTGVRVAAEPATVSTRCTTSPTVVVCASGTAHRAEEA